MNKDLKKSSDKVDLLNLLRDKKEKLLPVNVAANLLHTSLSTVYRLIEEGKLTAIRTTARNTLVLESSLNEYLKSLNPLLISTD